MKTTAARLIEIFKGAIDDFTEMVESHSGLSAVEIEKANFIVGTAKVSIQVLEHIEAYNPLKADCFLSDAVSFADSLQAEGLGIPDCIRIK